MSNIQINYSFPENFYYINQIKNKYFINLNYLKFKEDEKVEMSS